MVQKGSFCYALILVQACPSLLCWNQFNAQTNLNKVCTGGKAGLSHGCSALFMTVTGWAADLVYLFFT